MGQIPEWFITPGLLSDLVGGQAYLVSPDTVVYQRQVYSFLDFLGDVGGLLDALKLIGVSLISFVYGGSLQHFLLSKVFYFGLDTRKQQVFGQDNQNLIKQALNKGISL